MVFDVFHHLRAHEGVLEVGTQGCNQRAQQCAENEKRGSDADIPAKSTQKPWITVCKEVPQTAESQPPTRIDEVVRPANQAVQILLQGAGIAVRARRTQVRRRLSIEQPEIPQVIAAQGLHALGLDPADKRIEPVPVILARIDPEV